MTKKEIREIVMDGNTGKYSHVIIVCDTFDYEDYPVYVENGEDINQLVEKYNDYNKMSKIMEIYNYNLDLENQLNEDRAYHINPILEKGIEKNEAEKEYIEEDDSISENLKKAINYAAEKHKGQMRLTGDPYINHPLHVLQDVLKYKKSKNLEVLLISACLHDTLEDTDATYYDIVENFGPQVASLVLELTTDEDMKKVLGKKQYLSIKIKNMSSWARVIKLCDRLDNVNDLLRCDDETFKNKYINETIEIIDYLLKNAKLSNTQLTIIEQILYLLIKLSKDNNERIQKVVELINTCIDIKLKEFKEDDKQSQSIKDVIYKEDSIDFLKKYQFNQ